MRYSKVQMRMPERDAKYGKEIFFRNQTYRLGNAVPQTLRTRQADNTVFSGGFTLQLALLQEDAVVGEAWFYSYHSSEGKFWAVLDEVELYEEDAI